MKISSGKNYDFNEDNYDDNNLLEMYVEGKMLFLMLIPKNINFKSAVVGFVMQTALCNLISPVYTVLCIRYLRESSASFNLDRNCEEVIKDFKISQTVEIATFSNIVNCQVLSHIVQYFDIFQYFQC